MCLKIVDLLFDAGFPDGVTGVTRRIQVAEKQVQLTRVSLPKKRVELLDQCGYRGFLMHGLIRQRTEFRAQRGNHPAGKVQVLLPGLAKVLLDGDHFLLADKAMPAAQRLGELRRIGIVLRHITAHDVGRVLGNVQTGFEPVLGTHTSSGFRTNSIPGATCVFAYAFQ